MFFDSPITWAESAKCPPTQVDHRNACQRLQGLLVDEPETIDVLKYASCKLWRKSLRQWQHGVSDVAGCLALTNASRVGSDLAVMDAKCPTLIVLEHACKLGWKG